MNDDGTCAMCITFPYYILQFEGKEGKCLQNGESKGWLLTGKYDAVTQDGQFTRCNQHADYRASGNIGYGPRNTTRDNLLSCTLRKQDQMVFAFIIGELLVVK